MGKEEKPLDLNARYTDFKWKNPDEFKNGPLSDERRRCRDVCCCILFVLFLLGCAFVCYLGVKYGNPDLILYPYDEDGNQCGQGKLKDYKFLYFYNVRENFKNLLVLNVGVSTMCVKECPSRGETKEDWVGACYPTTKNPSCTVKGNTFYNSTGGKI